MKIYLMRHGESEGNVAGKFTGWWDAPLTERGIEQARTAKEKLNGIRFDRVFTSDLLRARQTCEAVFPGCDYTVDSRLRELHLGKLEGLPVKEAKALYPDAVCRGRAIGDCSSVGGESKESFWGRLKSFLSDIEKEGYERVALFTHAGVVRAIFNMTFDTMCLGRISNQNCVIAVFDLKDGKLILDSWNI